MGIAENNFDDEGIFLDEKLLANKFKLGTHEKEE